MKHRLFCPSRIALLSTTLIALSATPAMSAPSVCKGLDEAACATQAECRWMDGYTRKDGVQVSSHCRKGAKKAGEGTDAKNLTSPAPAVATEPTPAAAPAIAVPPTPAVAPAPAVTPAPAAAPTQ